MSEELIIKVDVKGQTDLCKVNKSIDQTGEYSEKATTEIGRLRKEIKEAKSDMLKYAEGTDQYNAALNRAARAQTKLKETNDVVRAGVKDLGQVFTMGAKTISGLAAGFQVAQGTMALFGIESENALKTIQNLTAIMSITQGIVSFAEGFDSLQDIMAGIKANSASTKGAITELSDVAGNAGDNLANLSKEGAVIGSNLAGAQGIKDAANNLKEFSNKSAYASLSLDELNVKLIELEKYAEDSKGGLFSGWANKEVEDVKKVISEKEKLAQENEKLAKTNEKASAGIGKQILTMGAWMLAIIAVTYAITSLIDWLNKIPEKTKVSIEVETTALEALKKDLVDVNKFMNDWRKAVYEGNKERISGLSKYAKEEFNFNDKKLAEIKKLAESEKLTAKDKEDYINNYKISLWKKQFGNYLQLAEDTYWNETIIKMKVDAQIKGKQALSTAQKLFKTKSSTGNFKGTITIGPTETRTWDELVSMANNGSLSESAYEALFVYGIPQQIIDNLREVNASNAIIKNLPKLRDINVIDIKKDTGSKSKKQIQFNTELLKPTPKSIDEENFIWKEFTKRQKTNVEQAQQEISKQFANLKGIKKYLGPNQFDLINADIKLLNASLKDNSVEIEKNNNILKRSIIDKNQFDKKNKQQKDVTDELNKLYKKQFDVENELRKIPATDKNKISEKQKENELIQNQIKEKEKLLATLKQEIQTLQQGTTEYETAYSNIISLEVERDKIEEDLAQKRRDRFNEELNMVKDYISAFSSLTSGVSDYYQGEMDLTNKYYNQLAWNAEEYITNEEYKNKRLYEIEMDRYNALYEDFENQKKYKEAQAWMDFASGSVGIWTAPGITALAPYGYILAGIQEAGLLASTIGNVKSIRAQTLDKPHKPSSSSGMSSNNGYNVALNPNKNTLTTKDENLNSMQKRISENMQPQYVKVSEINKIQKKVEVSETNSTY